MSTLYRYLRHSEESRDQPNSREAQSRAINAWVDFQASRGVTYSAGGEFYDADVSGGVELIRRPAGGVLLGRVQPGDVIVAAKWDRMFRDCRDGLNTLHSLNSRNISVVCIDFNVDTRTAAGYLMATQMLAFAEFERKRISERTKEGLAIIKFNRGVKISYSCRLGWKRVRKHKQTRKDGQPYAVIEPWWEERKECERIVYLCDIRRMSFAEVAQMFSRNGEKCIQDGRTKWTYEMVKKRYRAAKAMYPRRDYSDETGENQEILMVPVEVKS